MKIFFFILTQFLFFVSCQPGTDSTLETKKEIKLSAGLKPIVDSLVKFNVVHDDAIGYAAVKSNVYLNFKKFMAKATDDELINLTDHDSATVRAYSFWVLAKRKNPKVKDLLSKHLYDSASFFYLSGCTGGEEKINEFYLNLLTPNYLDLSTLKLTPEEVENFQKKIGH